MQPTSKRTARDTDAERKREQRAESARIFIPACVNPQRRERCLADPELFLRGTYLANRYKRPFGKLHYAIMDALIEVAKNGGKLALAAPRGRGKTELVKGMLLFLICAGYVRFPIPVCQTTSHAAKIYNDLRKKVALNDLLLEDFPELCYPVRALEGAPQRAGRQHVDGHLTNIMWTNEALRFATVPAKYRGPIDYGLVNMEYRGLDAAIRGVNVDGARPDFVIIDDPETRESAKSESQIEDRTNAIEQDIAGLAGEDEELAQVMLTTVQNRYCISFQYTDPEQKPSWMGRRFGWVEKWPEEWTKEEGLWHTYIAMRGQDQRNGDRYGRTATEFFLANRDAMELGGELLADNYKFKVLSDGWITVHSAWQVVFNAIADTSYDAFCTEYQNDPPESEQIQTIDLTHSQVLATTSGLLQYQIPDGTKYIVRGIDMGKVRCWYVDIAFDEAGTSSIIDYGIFTTVGLSSGSSDEAIELAMLSALINFAAEHDKYKVDVAFVDSGYKPEAVYEACRRIKGSAYYPVKGPSSVYRMPKPNKETQCFFECHASQVFDQYRRPVWLFHPNVEYWKNWLQERFMTTTFIEGNRNPGSMALFEPPNDDIRFHGQFSRSMVSERLEHVPLPGKDYKKVWYVADRTNNHWLDAAGYACAAAAFLGVRLLAPEVKPKSEQVARKPVPKQPRNNIRRRPGGWIKGMKK